jgi:hypothetical protein
VHPIYCEYIFFAVRFHTDFETRIVGNSDEGGCLNANSPSSTASLPTAPILNTSAPSSGTPSDSLTTQTLTSDDHNSNKPTGVVIGGVIVGSIVTLVALSTLGMFLYTRRKSTKEAPSAYFSSGKRGSRRVHSMDLTAAPPSDPHSPPMYPPQEYHTTPLVFSPQSGYGPQRQDEYSLTPYSPFSGGHSNAAPSSHSGEESAINPFSNYQGSISPGSEQFSRSRGTSISSKAAMAGVSASGYGLTPRFVLHTDAGAMDEVMEEVVELPPTYHDVSRGTAPNTPTAAIQSQSPTASPHSFSGDASDGQSHPLAPSPLVSTQSKPSTPPVLPPLNHQLNLDSSDLGNGLALGSRSPPQSPRGNSTHPATTRIPLRITICSEWQ